MGTGILVIEEDPAMCRMIQKVLSLHGAIAMVTSSGYDALRLVAQHDFDLFIADHAETDDFLPLLVAAQPDARVLLCGSPDAAYEVLPRPFQVDQLVTKVADMLGIPL